MTDLSVRSCVWYVEARRTRTADESPAMGSAVAIRVRNTRTNVCKSLLLTCAHLVKSSDEGYGQGPLRGEVLCWRPLWGYVPYAEGTPWPEVEHDGIYAAKVWDVWQRPAQDDWNESQCRDAADWVLLEVIEPSFQDLPYLTVTTGSRSRSITVIGYPMEARLGRRPRWSNLMFPTISVLVAVRLHPVSCAWMAAKAQRQA